MRNFFKGLMGGPKVRKAVGVFLVVVGVVALITPLSPGSWLIPIGLGLLGVRLAFWEKLKAWWKRARI